MEYLNRLIAEINGVEITTTSAIVRLTLSLILGSLVGMERKRKGQIAGIRTFALISMGATLAMILSIYVPQEYMGLKNGDPGRIAAQVITGIGFLGAGAIIQMKGSVRGLTTAAGIWMVATIGMTVGVGMYTVALVATAFILFILLTLERIEHRIGVGAETRIIRIRVAGIVDNINDYRTCLMSQKVTPVNTFVDYDYTEPSTRLNLVVLIPSSTDYVSLFALLHKLRPDTTSITLSSQTNI
ncbi:MAG: MgtC/SapB family protein [Pseudoflavonifractor sp.]|nr:MgtC/SapB family protein [Alloprevotella sp.]MCM1116276.1 MgtC/SapB family protein [Pseudoflavonifractor sp.]